MIMPSSSARAVKVPAAHSGNAAAIEARERTGAIDQSDPHRDRHQTIGRPNKRVLLSAA
jgi:hypothetical protein